MKRIQKERDRLLRKIARIYGLTGAVGALLCIIVPVSTLNCLRQSAHFQSRRAETEPVRVLRPSGFFGVRK